MGAFKKKEVEVEEKRVDSSFKINLNIAVPKLPELTEDLNVVYPLIEPYVQAHIYHDSVGELVYDLKEPVLDKKEEEVLVLLEEGIKELINISFIAIKDQEAIIDYLEKNVRVILKELGMKITKETYFKLMYYIYRDFVGLGNIEAIMRDYYVEDVECNGVNYPVYIVHRKYRNLKTNMIFKSTEELANFVERLAQKCGKYVSYANPILEGSLSDGSRVSATYSKDVTSRGPSFVIRKFTKEPWSPIKLMQLGTVSPEILAYLWLLIDHQFNVMVIGGTGTGKTTMLNVLAFFVPPSARIVSIEDTREINLLHDNWLPSVAREGLGVANLTGEKYGEVSLFDLLKESLRQNPDYVVVGEVRGKEAYVLFQGMASGHPSFGTMHADSVGTMIKRLETNPINLSPTLVNAMDVVCVMAKTKFKNTIVRRLKDIVEVIDVERGEAGLNIPFRWDPATGKFLYKQHLEMFNRIISKSGVTMQYLNNEWSNRTKLLIKLYQNNIFDFSEVQEIINNYYKNPQKILKQFEIV